MYPVVAMVFYIFIVIIFGVFGPFVGVSGIVPVDVDGPYDISNFVHLVDQLSVLLFSVVSGLFIIVGFSISKKQVYANKIAGIDISAVILSIFGMLVFISVYYIYTAKMLSFQLVEIGRYAQEGVLDALSLAGLFSALSGGPAIYILFDRHTSNSTKISEYRNGD